MRPSQETIFEIRIENSKFIGILIPFNGDLKSALASIKNTYKKATHYCYAFSYQKEKGVHDDGEPAKTAGFPILKMLEKYQLENTLLVVVRYFGGILLGTGGLIRAYQKTAEETIRKAKLVPLHEGYQVRIEVPYEKLKTVEYLLRKDEMIQKEFKDKVQITAFISLDKLKELEAFTPILEKKEVFY